MLVNILLYLKKNKINKKFVMLYKKVNGLDILLSELSRV